jgi:hypothetical protein
VANNNKTKKDKVIKDYPIVELSLDEIHNDPTNPNEMNLEQTRGLEKSLMEFGRLKPIVVDQNNILIDGQHRLEVERAMNTKEKVKCVKVHVKDEIERKMMRETLNKLHGSYNKEKESDELLEIFQAGKMDDLAEILATPKIDFIETINLFHDNAIPMNEVDEASFKQKGKEIDVDLSELNSLKLVFSIPNKDQYVEIVSAITRMGGETQEESLYRLVKDYERLRSASKYGGE